jgi:hypothetical protein
MMTPAEADQVVDVVSAAPAPVLQVMGVDEAAVVALDSLTNRCS